MPETTTGFDGPHRLAAMARQIYLKTLEEVNLGATIKDKIKLWDGKIDAAGESISLDAFSEVVLISFGKASIAMAEALVSMLGDRITRSVVVTDRMQRTALKSEIIIAGHPLPNEESLKAGKRIIDLIGSCDDGTLLIFAISGGGSALVEWPLFPEISLEDLRKLNQFLTECGATIRDINIVRKSISAIKGGRLGYLARNFRKITLFASDVNPGDLESISSNPILPESLSEEELLEKLDRYSVGSNLPASLCEIISGKALETLPQQWEDAGGNSIVLISDNQNVMRAAATLADQLGCVVETETTNAEGDYKRIADLMVDNLARLLASHKGKTVCLISGGEASCVVRGAGFGGRNHEFVLYAAIKLIKGLDEWAVLSCGTDGIDGNSSASGAVLDSIAMRESRRSGFDEAHFLSISDSGSLINWLGGQIVTGPTGNNLRDIRVFLAQ
jgi:hydroxypyruvate reductase